MAKQSKLKLRIKQWMNKPLANANAGNTIDKGKTNETLALNYLRERGLKSIEVNYRCFFGEVDIIMRHEQALVFVEVRNRKSQNYGSPIETVTKSKQQRIIKTAQHYIMSHNISASEQIRFDVVGITDQSSQPIQWVQNAFYGYETN